jgi:hypothetical protein
VSALSTAADNLVAAANTVTGLRGYYGDRVGQLQLPAAVVGLPTLEFNAECAALEASFPVTVVVAMDDRSMTALFALVDALQAAIETTTRATVDAAVPVSYTLDNGEAVGFQLTVSYPA